MTSSRMQIRNSSGDVLPELEDAFAFDSDFWDYLEARVPKPGPEQMCEIAGHEEFVDPAFATTFFYTLEGDHICYTYICDECSENMVGDYDLPVPEDVPTDGWGYATDPQHCTS